MSLSSWQSLINVLLLIGGIIVVGATYAKFAVGQKIKEEQAEKENIRLREEKKEESIKLMEQKEEDKLNLALSHDPVLELSLIDNNRVNQFDFKLENSGTSVIDINRIYEMYYYKGESVGGVGEKPPFSYSISKTNRIEINGDYYFTLKFDDLIYNMQTIIEARKNNQRGGGPFTLKLTINYERVNDKKGFDIIKPFIVSKTINNKIECYFLSDYDDNPGMYRLHKEMLEKILNQ